MSRRQRTASSYPFRWRSRRLYLEELESRLAPSANIPLTTDPGVQQMPSIASDPGDANHLVVAYMDYSLVTTGYAGIGVAVSQDGGDSWQHSTVPLPTGFDRGAAAPMVRFDDSGHVFLSFMANTFLGPKAPLTDPGGGDPRALGFQSNNGVFVSRSEDGGLTWDHPVTVVSHLYDGQHPVFFEIKPDLAIDTFRTLPNGQPNPNFGNLYEVWSRYYPAGQFPGESDSAGGSQIMFAVSHDDGQSWQLQMQQLAGSSVPEPVILDPNNSTGGANNAGLGNVNWAHPVVGPEGDIYISLFFLGAFAVYHSTDAGQSFVAPDISGTRGLPFGPIENAVIAPLPNLGLRTNAVRAITTDPTRPGSVYTAEMINSVDDSLQNLLDASGNAFDGADIHVASSSDHSLTWQTHLQVGGQTASVLNDDNDGQVAHGLTDDVTAVQLMPRLATDAQGDVAVIWYDTRRDPSGLQFDVFGTVSSDGGQTFSPNFRVSDTSFAPNAGQFTDAKGQPDYYLGDAIGLALANNTGYAVWTDTLNGNQDIYFSRFSLQPSPAPSNDRLEPNNTAATATDLGRIVGSHLPKLAIPAGDEDWFRVTSAASGNLTVTATQETPGVSLRLELCDASGTTVLATGTDLRDASGQVIGQQIVFPSTAGQAFLVRVFSGPGATSEGPSGYTLDVQSLTADLGTQVHGVLTNTLAPGDEDAYRLAVGAPGSLQVQLTPGANFQGNITLEILDPNSLAVLASATGHPDQEASLAVEQGQSVLLHVVSDAGGHGNFTLEFTNFDQFITPQNNSLLFPAGQGPSQLVAADLNGDGKPDLVVANTLANEVSVLLGNGDGTFQAPRQFAVGAFVPETAALETAPDTGRAVAVADVNGDGIPDILVTNDASSDLSVLLGRGDGTFEPQRRVDTTIQPLTLAVGDFNGDGVSDVVVVDSASQGKVGVLLGRGDGTFQLAKVFPSPLPEHFPFSTIRIADLNRDGHPDLLLASDFSPNTYLFLGNGDGNFRDGGSIPTQGPGLAVADLNKDGNLDVVTATYQRNMVSYALGNGDGTFQSSQSLPSGESVIAATVADFGSAMTQPDGSIALRPPDGVPDLLVAATGLPQPVLQGPPQVLFYAGKVDAQGNFASFSNSLVLASPDTPLDIETADVNGDGFLDVLVVELDGVRVIFGKPPVIPLNDTPQTARNLGTVVHVSEPTQTIVPDHTDAYYKLTVPTEAARGVGDEILDFSGLFQALEGAGLSMKVRDAAGRLLGSGERFRIQAAQGAVLTLHVFGVTAADGRRGSGAYTLDIDVLPQVVSVEAQALLPGAGGTTGGPTASLVITLQGDRLDPTAAENPANYSVIWLGPDGLLGTADDQIIPIQAGPDGGQPVVYDPSSNVDVATGTAYPTAARQTVTLLFANPLPAGSYQIELNSAIQAAPFNADESGLLSDMVAFTGHPVASLVDGAVTEGDRHTAADLVFAPGMLGDLSVFRIGTPFLTQLHDDLGALLDAQLTALGDDPSISGTIDNQIIARFDPALGMPAARPIVVLVIWFDPVPLDLFGEDNSVTYNPQNNSFVNTFSHGFVSVAGNLEVLVLPFVPNGVLNYQLAVDPVPAGARGGAVYFGILGNQVQSLTAELRAGTNQFLLSFGDPMLSRSPPTLGAAAPTLGAAAPTLGAEFTLGSTLSLCTTPPVPNSLPSIASLVNILSTSNGRLPVTAINPLLGPSEPGVSPNSGSVPPAHSATVGTLADGGGSATSSQPLADQLLDSMRGLGRLLLEPLVSVEATVLDLVVPLLVPWLRMWRTFQFLVPLGNTPPALPKASEGLLPEPPSKATNVLPLVEEVVSPEAAVPVGALSAALLGLMGAGFLWRGGSPGQNRGIGLEPSQRGNDRTRRNNHAG